MVKDGSRVNLISVMIETFLKQLRSSTVGDQYAKNASFSIGEYVAIPVLNLAATPFLVGRMGIEVYGLWMFTNAIVGIAGMVNLGLGDATLRFVSMYRGRGETASIVRVVRTAYSISLLIALISGSLVFLCAPLLVSIVFKLPLPLVSLATQSFELGAVLLALRVMESVCTGTFWGYERYDVSAAASLGTRGTSLLAAVVLILNGFGLKEILAASVAVSLLGLMIQATIVHRLVRASPLRFLVDREELQKLFGFGRYAWLQNVAEALFGQADRLVIGAWLGASVLAGYAVCLQLVNLIPAVVSAGFSVLFPAVSRRIGAEAGGIRWVEAKKLILLNVTLSFLLVLPLIMVGDRILALWMNQAFAIQWATLLKLLAGTFFILSINVAVHYILLGAGAIRFVSLTNLIGGAVSLVVTIVLVPVAGVNAVVAGRFIYAGVVSVNVSRLAKVLK